MSKFNKKTRVQNKTTNFAGGKALKHAADMELVVSVLTTFLEDKFYESGDERMERIKNLIALNKPEFVAKLALVAREDFHLRSVSHLLTGELSLIHRGDNLVSRLINKVAERVDDLIEILSYVEKPIPNQVKKGIAKALQGFNRYQLAKYKMEGKDVKLVDLFNLIHPKPKTKEQKKDWKDLMEGKLKNEETWEARLSAGENKKKVWSDLVHENKIGYMALLRNLRNIEKDGDKATIKQACQTISYKDNVLKSKQLPFRFLNAYENVTNQDMLEAIAMAMDFSLANVPTFKGKTLIAIDKSGSMSGDPIKKASIFGAALMKANNADVILYADQVKPVKFLKGTPVLGLASMIENDHFSGGTDTSLVFDYAEQQDKKYDRIIILSDNESWVDSIMGQGSNATKNRLFPDTFIYALDLAGYGTKDIGGNKVFHLAGWSEKIFNFMEWIEKENACVDFINKKEL
jgi:60 kDa SS-A/Ro ribonucleoprotein